ncbi:putative cation channel family transporter [Aspergillus campestris IBT 28561]|uniref:Cation channel family transporter n=1 Tax=Aspergillus campestris (strain IBT 28561) TaxID=1392248 RepID=A0A2I1DHL0_ASPC2|nr:putative cation channel family transporter [Aspergillus campestris IBT 28561]PKY09350.1 putative cation channel family transporter [Aspergillus campestris IBT 28561]
MLASLLRPKKRRVDPERSPFASRHPARQRDFAAENEYARRNYGAIGELDGIENEDQEADRDEEEDGAPLESTPLLPIFSASHLDTLPVFEITHAIRPLVVSRCETTLTWDQLRSPQISQFLVKPIQQRIRSQHFSRATLYALMANCLQFISEAQSNPGNSGTCQTRAMVSELLAIKLLREYSTEELIDALSYEFYPLQGQPSVEPPARKSQPMAGVARISCLELAIRAQAKRFISHPLVVQQLGAIWAGTIVFHYAADSLHRSPARLTRDERRGSRYRGAASTQNRRWGQGTSPPGTHLDPSRSVTLYNPREASLCKLSRLRVPRYRQFLSTVSFAVLLGLFLAVLQQRKLEITPLELVFWFWSAGFMMDEIVGFNEQGFSLYLMSFWNLFDLGILFLLFCYYCMRIYAVAPYTRSQAVADQAYDILAANAVLLFPRLFSILDHYRYFSQLLIAFRIMAADLVAVFVLIIIACSGFFVAFTLSFGTHEDHSPGSVAYALFQILMGFSPAAWALWDDYNILGRTVLTVFLFICHFVVVTILITVLTNSFMRIVQNADQEHQFLFAVNCHSMVKSDALFSYIAPANILAWLLTPLRYVMPFQRFVQINRTIIKVTHLPILLTIYLYEKVILSSRLFEPTDLIRLTESGTTAQPRMPRRSRIRSFISQGPRFARQPSVATYQKDRALEELFRRASPDLGGTDHTFPKGNKIVDWMHRMGSGSVHPPDEQDSDEMDRLETTPKGAQGRLARRRAHLRSFTESRRSARSNPEDHISNAASSPVRQRPTRHSLVATTQRQISQHTGMEGDDELTSDNNGGWEDEQEPALAPASPASGHSRPKAVERPGKATRKGYPSGPSTARMKSRKTSPAPRPNHHLRTRSSVTAPYPTNPGPSIYDDAAWTWSSPPIRPRADTPDHGGVGIPTSTGHPTDPRSGQPLQPVLPPSIRPTSPMSLPALSSMPAGLDPRDERHRRQTALLQALGSDLGDNRAIVNGFLGEVPSSWTTQIAYGMQRGDGAHDQDMLSKLVLARMNNIEEGFREVIREVKDLRQGGTSRGQSRPDEFRGGVVKKKRPGKKESGKKSRGSS